MNIEKMARADALRAVDANHLYDEISNKIERLSGYMDAYHNAFEKLAAKQGPAHWKAMNQLRDRLDKIEMSRTAGFSKTKLIVGVVAIGAAVVYVQHQHVQNKRAAEEGNNPPQEGRHAV